MDEKVSKGRGRPKGIAREGKYGTGVKTKVVRVPETIADNIQDILQSFESIKAACDNWDERLEDATSKSKTGELPVRYTHAVKLLNELRTYLGE